MKHKLLLALFLLSLAPGAHALGETWPQRPCPVFVTDPDPDDPTWGHCSLRRPSGDFPMPILDLMF